MFFSRCRAKLRNCDSSHCVLGKIYGRRFFVPDCIQVGVDDVGERANDGRQYIYIYEVCTYILRNTGGSINEARVARFTSMLGTPRTTHGRLSLSRETSPRSHLATVNHRRFFSPCHRYTFITSYVCVPARVYGLIRTHAVSSAINIVRESRSGDLAY